ncbi:MAG TPA: DUF5661 family protein, partial [Candidatus Nitrosocosmicus sp.]|nr:DUF5661 family protein [Candidatus Nitrosocosmicus sp.]
PYICPYWKKMKPVFDPYVEPAIMSRQKTFTKEEALAIGKAIGIDFKETSLKQFQMGLEVELEHGTRFPKANVTDDDPILTGRIAYAHLLELPDYYTRLAEMEKEAKAHWGIED